MIRRALFLTLSLASALLASVDVAGTVTDATTDIPLPKVRIFGPDSAFLDATDAQGRFLLVLPRPQTVVFRKDGFKDRVVVLSELGNLLDVQVDLEPTGTRLETGTVTGSAQRRHARAGTIEAIEEVSGLRFDLQEHLRTLPGVGGTREYSSEVSVYGSRTADVTHVLGAFPIPNMRHLDHSFPGNQSVLSPRVLRGISVEHDPSNGPLEQGLASALRYQPRRAPQGRYEGVVSLGLTNRELDLLVPMGDGGIVASGRWLDPSLLEHLGGRFYTGGSGRSADDRTNDGPVSKLSLQAFDGYLRGDQGIGSFGVSGTFLGAFDDYAVKLKVSPFRADGSKSEPTFVPFTQGNRGDQVAFLEAQGDLPSGFLQMYLGLIRNSEAQLLSDSNLYAEIHTVPLGGTAQSNPQDWGAWTRDQSDFRVGGMFRPNAPLLGAEAEVLAAWDLKSDEYVQGRTFRSGIGGEILENRRWSDLDGNGIPGAIHMAPQWNRVRSSARLHWVDGETRTGVSVGGLWVDEPGWSSEGTASLMTPLWGLGWVSNLSLRALESPRTVEPGKVALTTTTSWEGKLGAGKRVGDFEFTGTVYLRSLTDPALPVPGFWRALPLRQTATEANVQGAALQGTFDGWERLRALVNVSRVQGEYTLSDGSILEWDANRDVDVLTQVRIHPMADTLLAVILTHVASLGKPEYVYRLDTLSRRVTIAGDPAVAGGSPKRDAFRTDLRAELDLGTKVPPIDGIRLYFEVQNLFSGFTGDWARVLGGDNYRSRSYKPNAVKYENGVHSVVEAEPQYARGTDLFLTFGVQGSLGI